MAIDADRIADFSPPPPIPTPGRIVLYRLSADDALRIRTARADRTPAIFGSGGTVAPVGNEVNAGDVYPAVLVRVWGDTPESHCNIQVLLDGPDTYWATSRQHSHDENAQGTWSWPPRV